MLVLDGDNRAKMIKQIILCMSTILRIIIVHPREAGTLYTFQMAMPDLHRQTLGMTPASNTPSLVCLFGTARQSFKV